MRTAYVSDSMLNRFLFILGVCLVLALGCTQTMYIEASLEAHSCTDDAQTMSFVMNSTSLPINYLFLGGTPNVLGIPSLVGNPGTFYVALDHANKGDKVQVKYGSHVVLAPTLTVTLADVSFYKATADLYPTVPDCAVIQTPKFTITQPVPQGNAAAVAPDNLVVEVTDPGALPLTLVDLDFAEAPGLLPADQLDWNAPALNALSWQAEAPGGLVLDAASAPAVINLPGATSAPAVLCRFISVYDGMEVRGILQVDVVGATLETTPSTWGAVKSLYHG